MRTNNNCVKWYYIDNETHCVVQDRKGNDLATGIATKYAKDKPNKILGRDTSFRRAMTQAADPDNQVVSKKDRKEIWDTYRTTVKQPE